MGSPVPSPCRDLCALDAARQTCTGCGRTMDEIARWSGMTDAERTAIMARVRGFRPR
ncbi:DUF1289 domain-containing protein [Sphingobium amiense]|uniref:DUF1289 domain-containing protein n=1 Tax=Sphingobium amiense TaxID=135719 RepID=UPI00082E553D|nr:DUF1289 domain-containing protein [Sphingobium amiense]